jgi:hypothetical protein
MMNHATVKLDGKKIPLIGIPAVATTDTCDICRKTFHISDLRIDDAYIVCVECQKLAESLAKIIDEERKQPPCQP